MSDKEAAVLIGKFFPEIKDKLLNTLQLTDNLDRAYQDLHEQEAFMRRIGVWQRFCNLIKEKFRERQEAERNDHTR